jgi:hypothetical protein
VRAHCICYCIHSKADTSDRAVSGVGLRPFACGIAGSNPAGGMRVCLFVSVVSYQVQVSASGWSLVQRSRTEYGVSECDREASKMGRPWPSRALQLWGGGNTTIVIIWWSGSDVLSILHSNMVVCYLHSDVLLCFSYVWGSSLGVLCWRCNALWFFPV